MSLITLQLRLLPRLESQRLLQALSRPNLTPPDTCPFTPTPAGRQLEREVRRLFQNATPKTSPCIVHYQSAETSRGPIIRALLGNGHFKSHEIELPAPSIIWIPPEECHSFATSLKRRRNAWQNDEVTAINHLTVFAAAYAASLPDTGLLLCIDAEPASRS